MKPIFCIVIAVTLSCGIVSAQNIISVQAGSTASGDTGTFTVMMKNDIAVNGLNFLLRYSPDILQHLRIIPAGDGALLNGSVASLVGDNMISFLLYDTGPAMIPPDTGRIFEVRYVVTDSLHDSTSAPLVFTEGTAADSAIGPITFGFVDGVVHITPALGIHETVSDVPRTFRLGQNYPNPFNPSTTIRYQVPVSSRVRLAVYNILGQCVSVLFNDVRQAGYHIAEWNARDIASGVYFYRMQASSVAHPGKAYIAVKKMILLR